MTAARNLAESQQEKLSGEIKCVEMSLNELLLVLRPCRRILQEDSIGQCHMCLHLSIMSSLRSDQFAQSCTIRFQSKSLVVSKVATFS